MKNVMTTAWKIAKEGAAKFGGSVKSYFAEALKMAWAQVKVVAFDTTSVLAVGLQGENGYIAIPANVKVERVVDGIRHIATAQEIENSKGEKYNMYAILLDLKFRVDVGGKEYSFKMIKDGRIFFNGAK